jgi:glycosyltransferase involved in cell wall biosynthesis
VRILFLTDRLSVRGGADQHLLQVIEWACPLSERVVVACGRREGEAHLPGGIDVVRLRGLGSAVTSRSGLDRLDRLLDRCDVVHLQNVMNPVMLQVAVATGRAVVTVQDHRVFCPASGKTLPDGSRCTVVMSEQQCTACLPDATYRARTVDLTRSRRDALRQARLVVLSRYMADELAAVGLTETEVIPPSFESRPDRLATGEAFLLGGRLVHHKGVLDGWRGWRASGTALPLRVAGAGPLEPELEGAEHLGWLSQWELRAELRRARALLFPSRWQEPFGIVGVQALAEGTPVVVAESGGTGDWSDAGCLRVPAGDVDAMAEAISELADHPRRALELGREGQTMVARRFCRERLAPRLHALYAEVTS